MSIFMRSFIKVSLFFLGYPGGSTVTHLPTLFGELLQALPECVAEKVVAVLSDFSHEPQQNPRQVECDYGDKEEQDVPTHHRLPFAHMGT
jgi:hypothetical protein